MQKTDKELRQDQLAKIAQKKSDYLTTFSTPEGKRVLKDLEDSCFIHQSTFSPVPGKSDVNEGMRFVVVNIKNLMNMNLKELYKIIEMEDSDV